MSVDLVERSLDDVIAVAGDWTLELESTDPVLSHLASVCLHCYGRYAPDLAGEQCQDRVDADVYAYAGSFEPPLPNEVIDRGIAEARVALQQTLSRLPSQVLLSPAVAHLLETV